MRSHQAMPVGWRCRPLAICQWELSTPTDISIPLTRRLVIRALEAGECLSAFNCAKQLQVRNESEKGRIAPAFRYFCIYLITVLFSHPPLPRTVPGESRCRGGLRSNLHRTESWCHPDSQTAAPARMLFRVHRYLPCCGS